MDDDEQDPNWCAFHYEIEQPGLIRCFECKHWFTDEAAFEADSVRRWADSRPFAEIGSCPWCSHDM